MTISDGWVLLANLGASKYETIKTEKVSPTADKYSYINLDWWNGFNDEYLNGYIIRALENNKDLKINIHLGGYLFF